MKKHILSFAIVAGILVSIAGCSSEKKAGSSDSTGTMSTTKDTMGTSDSAKTKPLTDTVSKGAVDTTKKPPM
jgi:predicted small lipoprotein YifL